MADSELVDGSPSDEQLLAGLRAAVECSDWERRNHMLLEFYGRYASGLAVTWLRRTGRAELTQEIVQETFLRATASLHRMPENHSVLIWLRTTARNYYVDRMRKSRAEQAYQQSEGRSASPRSGRGVEDKALAEIGRSRAEAIVNRQLATLAPLDRQVLSLRLRGVQMRLICERLKITETECRRCYGRIRQLLERMRRAGLSSYLAEILEATEEGGDGPKSN